MRFPTMGFVRPANAQTALPIHTVRSECFLVTWISGRRVWILVLPGISTTDECLNLFYCSKQNGVLKYKTNNETVQTTQTDKRADTDNGIHCTCMQYIFTTQSDKQSDTDNGCTATDLQYNIVHTNTIRLVHMSCLFLDMGEKTIIHRLTFICLTKTSTDWTIK